jgi:uncharacterized membrane protein YkoI
MRTKLIIGALALAFGTGTAFGIENGDVLGTDAASVRQALVTQGFEVRKIEAEDDDGGQALEAYAMKDGKRFEIYVDRQTGAVERIKQDD